MGTQPLDAAFAARQENRKKSSRRIVVLGALFVGLAGTAASVYAANVNINNSNDIVFAQGVEDVVSCDTDGATTDIASTFNAATGVFTVSTVTITGLMDECVGAAIDVYLTDVENTLGTVSTTVADGDADVNVTVADFSADSIDAAAVTDVAIEIRG
jgi:hypothetical protein